MKKGNYLFIMTLITSTMITLSANNWIGMWIGLEINMMSFIPLILSNSNKSSTEAAMIYFLTQSVSSMLLMMMVLILMCKYLIPKSMINSIIMISIFIKLGAAPFHMWMPKIMAKMEWSKCAILMTWQKMAPLFMISNIYNNNFIMNIIIIMSVSIGSLGGLNQTSLRKMMAYSSINHLGWMLSINKFMNLWMIYLLIYSAMTLSMCYLFYNYKLNFINQMSSVFMNNNEKISLFIMMLSMGGLPPFIGFLPKWITIQMLIQEQEIFITLIMVMFSLVTLMFYLRVMTNMYLSFSSSIKWSLNYFSYSTMMIMMINLSLPVIVIMDVI
uniref:NADH dehydrogenase subunit 2 n=1 Tax=Picromerus viridipunctatus TaxID=2021723 RepID=UPI002E767E16|nr:NADH dehydrogenase subunit 2 [Picromerus viridipunctatus]WPO01476.1 NADH dehydrogenase subunit 2 [Picromerus viridipunctatus]